MQVGWCEGDSLCSVLLAPVRCQSPSPVHVIGHHIESVDMMFQGLDIEVLEIPRNWPGV